MPTITFDIGADGDDGHIIGTNATYATARSTSSACQDSVASPVIGQYNVGTYYVHRMFLRWDTSALSGLGTPTAATLRLKADADYSVQDFTIQAVECDWAAAMCSNAEANYDAALASSTVLGTYDTSGGWTTDTWYEIALSPLTFIDDSGYTYLALRSDRDKAGTAPASFVFEHVLVHVYTNDAAEAPELVVAYGQNKRLVDGIRLATKCGGALVG